MSVSRMESEKKDIIDLLVILRNLWDQAKGYPGDHDAMVLSQICNKLMERRTKRIIVTVDGFDRDPEE